MTAPIPGASASASPSTPAFLRAATAADLPAVRQLLATANLPLDGMDVFFPAGYVVATGQDGALVGIAGLETYASEGFLRSVAVTPDLRGHGIGTALVQDRLAAAQAAGLTGVHLLTEDAAAFFARFGFAQSPRTTLPPEVQRSVLFARACPEAATAMSLSLSPGTLATRDEDVGDRHPPTQTEMSQTRPARAPRLMGAIAVLSLLTAPTAADSAPGDVARVRDAARAGTHAMAIADHLANRIGPRLTGSDRLAQACAWAQEELASYGLTDVRREAAGSIPVGFNRGPASGRMVEPETMALHFGTPAWSAGTSGVMRGPARRFATPLEADGPAGTDAPAGDAAHAWVLLPPSLIADPERYATLLTQLTRQRAAGVLLSSPAEWIPAGGDHAISWNALPSLPVIILRASEWTEIDRHVGAQTPVTLEFDIRQDFLPGPRPLHNVLGEIQGTELPDEVVLVGAHLDSWDAGTGATDNAAGCATTMAAARLLQTAAVAPRRTIRFVLFTGEEQGLIGSTAYTERHVDALALHSAVLVQDRGANPITGIEAPPRLAAELEQVLTPLRDMEENRSFAIRSTPVQGRPGPASCQTSCTPQAKTSCTPAPSSSAPRACAPRAGCAAGTGCSPNAGCASAASGKGGGCGAAGALCPSDHWPFLNAGVPAFLWLQDGTPADERHHTSLDTFDEIRGEDLEYSARLVALAALAIADHHRSLPREEIQPTRATP